jgi:hypothetical protein
VSKPGWVWQDVWDDAESCSMEELEAAADFYDRLVGEAGEKKETEEHRVPGEPD